MNTIVVLLHGDRLYQVQAERNQTVSFGTGKKDTVQVSGFEANQISVKIHFNTSYTLSGSICFIIPLLCFPQIFNSLFKLECPLDNLIMLLDLLSQSFKLRISNSHRDLKLMLDFSVA